MIATLLAALLAAQPAPAPPQRAAPTVAPRLGPQAPTDKPDAALAPAPTPQPRTDDDGIEIAGVEAGAVRTPSDAKAWGGIRSPDAKELSQRVADYELEATLDPVKHTIEGKERLTWKNRSDRPVRQLYFHLYLNAFESRGSTFFTEMARYGGFRSDVQTKKGEWGYIELKKIEQGGKALKWKFVHPDGGPETDHSVVRVELPEAVPAGGTAVLELDFHDQLPRVVARTGYFDTFHLVGQWFPKIGVLELPGERGATMPRWNCHEFHLHSEFYADFGNYRAKITVPAGYSFGSTGEETSPPQQTSLGILHTVAQDDIHDFAFTAWDKYAAPLEGTARGGKVKVKVLYPPEMAEAGSRSLKATIDALEFFSTTLGEYPYRQVTCVVPPFNAGEAGGMEYETFFTSIGVIEQPALGFVRFVAVHEFGHGYFMGLLASNEFEEPFLDEGLNEFWDNRMLQNRDDAVVATTPGLSMLGIRTPPIGWWDFERSGTQRFQADSIAGSSWKRYSSGSYALVYSRTSMVFHDLEHRLKDGVLARGFAEYYRRWHHRHPSTADLEEALASTAGDDAKVVHAWFETQVYERAPIDDRVEKIESEPIEPQAGMTERDGKRSERDEDEVKKEISEQQKAFEKAHPGDKEHGPFPFRTVVIARRYAAHVPQTLVVQFGDGTSETVQWPVEENWHRFVWEKPVRATSAQLDPSRNVLLDLNKLDDGRTREASHLASSRWTLEVSAWTQFLLSLEEAL